ncbi:LOW QUALITY PROTEIN: C-type lectin domain family 18 member A-like [Mixophyes fleayi]|uniref:LOW QUALITY PROTEIN: C-type lectin domain family 18 member A-like n=1 Tax=Mixophyes fleayi TaxID=3061075 RepID=UPI003F4DC65E
MGLMYNSLSLYLLRTGGAERFALVALHNKLRGNVHPPAANMRRMDWSETLGARASAIASDCHQNAPDDPQIGWNIQSFPAGTISLIDVINLWFHEGDDYNFPTSTCSEHRTCHHYTQLVWATSWELGCAMSRCPSAMGDTDVAVCAYAPGGNWDIGGQTIHPYQPGSWCSFCTSRFSGCYKSREQLGGLCEVPRNPCRTSCGNQGTLNPSSCRCECGAGYTGRFCQVSCGTRCVHGRFKAHECSCICDAGYGGADCAEELHSSAGTCDILSDGLCFVVSSELHSYYRAKTDCQTRDGLLAQIRTQKIQDILTFFLGRLEDTNKVTERDIQTGNFWIGLTYKSGFSSFRWDAGDPFSFQSFALGQPDNLGLGNCVEMRANSGFNWHTQRCKSHNRYICQYRI